MKKRSYTYFALSAGVLILFILYTAAVMLIDVKPIGPLNSAVGFSAINSRLHDLFGVNMWLYDITDLLSLAAALPIIGFTALGLIQLIKRKGILRVDSSLLVLGGFYLLVLSAYLFFELYVVNYRPVLINGLLEGSYPSSTTMLVMCVMPTAMMQLSRLLKNKAVRRCVNILCGIFTVVMVIGRLLSGVHWFTDIVGGALLSAALVLLCFSVNRLIDSKRPQ